MKTEWNPIKQESFSSSDDDNDDRDASVLPHPHVYEDRHDDEHGGGDNDYESDVSTISYQSCSIDDLMRTVDDLEAQHQIIYSDGDGSHLSSAQQSPRDDQSPQPQDDRSPQPQLEFSSADTNENQLSQSSHVFFL